jgi:hypothetical protein
LEDCRAVPSPSLVDFLTLKTKALEPFKTSVTVYPATRPRITEPSLTPLSEPRIVLVNKFKFLFIGFCVLIYDFLFQVLISSSLQQCAVRVFFIGKQYINIIYICYGIVGNLRLLAVTAVRKTKKSKSTSSVNCV